MAEDQSSDSLTVWDSRADPPEHAGPVYRWNGLAETASVRSLLRYAETHGERLRRKYLEWIHDLGESRIEGKRIIDHLALGAGLSYWWMTLLAEKSFYKSPITDAIRLLAVEEIVFEQKPGVLRLVSANRILHETLRDLCHRLAIDYEWKRIARARSPGLRDGYRALPHGVQALASLARHLFARWPLRRACAARWFDGDRALFFCSYFIHLDRESCAAGTFHSHHWEGLPKLLHENGYATNWIQHYLPSGTVPNTRTANEWLRTFNCNGEEHGFHRFLDAYLSWRVVLRVLAGWFQLTLLSLRLGNIGRAFHPPGSRLSLWPLLRRDWNASMRGAVAINNLLLIELFDIALRDLPHQGKGLYLCENQAWERALIHAWRKYRHGQLIAVAHATVRFWDLRYFADRRTLRSSGPGVMPQADLVALNGKAAVSAYLDVGFPREAIAECEALRYGYLKGFRVGRSAGPGNGKTNVLILGDYLPSATIQMLQLLVAADRRMAGSATYTVKPHPGFTVAPADFPTLQLKVVTDPVGNILRDFDIAYSSNMTSTAVDAYLGGLPVVVMLDETELNFSPLRGQTGVRFVSTPEELGDALQVVGGASSQEPDRDGFFFLDPKLPRWKRLLSIGDSD